MSRAGLKALVLLCALFLWAGSGWAQDYSFRYTCGNQGQVIDPDSLALFQTILSNTGIESDTYRVVLDKNLPVSWYGQACVSQGCFSDSAPVSLAPAEAETIKVDIGPLGTAGAGTVTMRVRSQGDPVQAVALPLTAITNIGVDVLVVDDDGLENYETYYQAALDSAGLTHGTLNHDATIVDTSELFPFQVVVWFTGEATPVLTAQDRQIISAYLNGGGRLFISGQDIAYALCDSASGEADSSSNAWFRSTFFGTEYWQSSSDTLVLHGYAGDPISDGITLSIEGGDGANNQTSPDVLFLSLIPSQARMIFHYASWLLSLGAVTVHTSIYKLVYFAFGFEAIDNAADRALVMERVMDWLMTPTPVEDQADVVSRPVDFFLSPNYPNPFNAITTFRLTIPEQESSPISLKVYNVLGQEVCTLVDGLISPGHHLVIWDGKDNLGHDLASGVYFSQLNSGSFSQTRKIILAR